MVDDAIIAIEMMIVKMESGWDRVQAAGHAWSVTAAPMLFGTLVAVAGFVPIGCPVRSGEYTGNIFWVLAFSLLISGGVCFALIWQALCPITEHMARTLPKRVLSAVAWGDWRVFVPENRRFYHMGLLAISAFGMAAWVQKQFSQF